MSRAGAYMDQWAGRRILLVDGSHTNRSVLKAHLIGDCYEFITARNASEGLELVATSPPDLVLCDIFVPDFEGLKFVRALRTHAVQAMRRIPIILMAQKRDEVLARRAIDAGADTFMSKPFEVDLLMRTVRELLARSARLEGDGDAARADDAKERASKARPKRRMTPPVTALSPIGRRLTPPGKTRS
jgi:CheY-like chemotaxis protein